MAPNTKLRSDDGSERQTENSDGSKRQNWEAMMMALNAKTENMMMMALNTKLRRNNDSERRVWKAMMALNARLRDDDGSEHQNRECDFERQTEEW